MVDESVGCGGWSPGGQADQQKVGHQVGQVGQVPGYWMLEVEHLKNHQVKGFLSAPQSQLLHSCFKIKKIQCQIKNLQCSVWNQLHFQLHR